MAFQAGPRADGPDGRACAVQLQVNLMFKNGMIGLLSASYDAALLRPGQLEVVGFGGRFVLVDACEHLTYYPRRSRETERSTMSVA
jgi:hypothetical protein